MIKIKHLGDITKLNGAEIPVVDCIIGGSPCQDLSVAGLRKGMLHTDKGDEETTRSGLFMEQLRIIKEMREHEQKNGRTPRPRLMVWENVPGAFSSNDGDDFRAVLEETARVVDPTAIIPRPEGSWTPSGCILGRGWSIAWRVHDAQFWGVAQRRRRIALVADFGGESAPSLLFESKGMSGDTEPSRETRKGTSPSTSNCIDDTSRAEIEDFVDAVNSSAIHQQDLIQSDLGISRTLAPGTHASGSHLTKTLITSNAEDSDFIFQQNQRDECRVMDVAGAITSESGMHNQNFAVTYGVDTYNQTAEEEVSATLKSGGEQPKVMTTADTDVTYCLQGNGIDRADTAGCNGKGWKEDIAYTLNTIDRPAVVSIDMGGGKSSCVISNEQAPTLTTTHDGAPAIVHLASGKDVTGCLMASGYDKLGAQEMFSGDYLVIKEPTDAVTLETFHCTSEEELAPPLKARDYKEPLVVFSKSRRAKDKDDYTTWVESNVANTLNAFDQGEVRTNELVIEEQPKVTTYSQDSFDEFSENNVSSALRHSGGPAGYGGNAIVVESYGVTSKGNGDAFINPECSSSLTAGGGMAGQGYPCVMILNPDDSQGNQVADEDGVYPTLRGCGGAGYQQGYVLAHNKDEEDVIAFEPGAASRLGTGVYSNVSGCLRASMGDNQMAVVYGIDQQGGKGSANYTENVSPTIMSESHGTPNAVAYGFDPGASRDVGELFLEETSKTLSNGTCPGHHNGVVVANGDTNAYGFDWQEGRQVGDAFYEQCAKTVTTTKPGAVLIPATAYNIDSEHSNSMKSDNPNSGFHETSVAKTLDTSSQNPSRQQGGTVLVQDVYSVENHPADSRVDLGEDGSVQTLTGRMGTGGGNVPLVALGIDAYNLQSTGDVSRTLLTPSGGLNEHLPLVVNSPSAIDVELEVSKRKFEVDTDALIECLSTHRSMPISEIAEKLDYPKTKVEHWFRKDKYFAIPDPEVWPKLKALLNITTDEFDESIMTFETSGGTYDMRNRIYTGDTTPTITANGESTMMLIENQPQTTEEDIYSLDRASFNQGKNAKFGFQVEKNISPTQVAAGPSAVATVGALCYDDYKGANNQYVDQNKVVTSPVVRRLTPLECERLQGFPDFWTKLDSWVDTKGKTHTNSDSARYKALGNSIALPFWDWLLGRIHRQYNRVATLGSLFDGIGGFPYCWEKHNGVGTALWASEIEEFPIAVTKVHFPEVDVENYSWWADYCKAVEQEKPVEITESKFSASPKKHKLF